MQRIGIILLSLMILTGLIATALPGAAVTAQGQSTPPPTNTPRGTMPATLAPPTETPFPVATATASPTATETATATTTATPTDVYNIPPSPTVYYPPYFTPQVEVTAIPTAMPRWGNTIRDADGNPYNMLNIVLIGHDSESLGETIFRTDTMIIVNVNLDTGTVSMLHLPRDLMVFIPDWGMQRLNLAWDWGDRYGWTDGGWGMFRQTVLYNFGIELHYYAMVDFSGFKSIIDTLDGVTVAVDCPIQDYMFTGDYNEEGAPLFELTTLPVGVHHLNSTEALWYARSRKSSNDFDRGRRQQQILRAIFHKSRELGLITQLPELWDDMNQVVETNLPLPVLLELLPMGLTLEPSQIENHIFHSGVETRSWTAPDGGNVQLLNPAVITLVTDFLTPPTSHQLVSDASIIAVYDGSGGALQWDVVAAERLLWDNMLALPMGTVDQVETTTIIDYTGETKGSIRNELARLLNIPAGLVADQPDAAQDVDYMVILGQDYNSCVDREVVAPRDVTATPVAGETGN